MPTDLSDFLGTLRDLSKRLQPLGQMAEAAGGMFSRSPFAAFLPTQGRSDATAAAPGPPVAEPAAPPPAPLAEIAAANAAAASKRAAPKKAASTRKRTTAKKPATKKPATRKPSSPR
jgi:hypothetical protein